MATRTLNQIRAEIQQFARRHGQIRTAKFRQLADLLADGDIEYPALYYIFTGSQKERNVLRMSFQVGICARALQEWTNVPDVWSDCQSIACDLLAHLDSDERDYKLIEGVQIRPLDDATDTGDHISGVSMDITLQVSYPYNRCIIPQKPDGYLVTEDGVTIETEDGISIITE